MLASSSVLGDLPGKNTGVGCHFLLQAVFVIQGLNPCPPIGEEGRGAVGRRTGAHKQEGEDLRHQKAHAHPSATGRSHGVSPPVMQKKGDTAHFQR